MPTEKIGKIARGTCTHAKQTTACDLDILRWVGANGVASLAQLAACFWPRCSPQTAKARLDQLGRTGLLDVHYVDVRRRGERVYTLTTEAVRLFSHVEQEHLVVGLPSLNILKHLLMANDARLLLEKQVRKDGGRLVQWITEGELRAQVCRRIEAARRVSMGGSRGWGVSQPVQPVVPITSENIPDARAVLMLRDGEYVEVDIEIDGRYFGKMLTYKAAKLGASGSPVVWACEKSRVAPVTQAVMPYGNITVLDLD